MRSSTGAHFIALDHVRALAAFMVFAWHFTHGSTGSPIPFSFTPAVFPLALFDEGHVGVALFMTLSGYLFAKLLDGRSIRYSAFLWNRLLRLLPLLLVVLLCRGWLDVHTARGWLGYGMAILRGVWYPSLPNGGWSITVELHFYVLLPLLLWLLRRSRFLPLLLIPAAIAMRFLLYRHYGQIQSLAYWTFVGRVDQFVLGMLAFQFRELFARRHLIALATFLGFSGFYWLFDLQGGYYFRPSYPSPFRLWIVMTTIEGSAFAALIAWYDTSFVHSTRGISKLLGRLGSYSYSMYLLHFFYVFEASRFVDRHVMRLDNFYVACAWALVVFLAAAPLSWLSFVLIESPFLRLRRSYVVTPPAEAAQRVSTTPLGA